MSTDFPGKIDLTECEREPICHLGLIQPHGALLAANSDAIITHASANVEQYIGIAPANALGRPLDQVLGAISARTVVESFASIREGQFHHEFWEGFASSYSLWTHRRDSRFILEWEPPHSSESEWKGFVEQVLPQGLLEIRGARDIHRQAQLAADGFRPGDDLSFSPGFVRRSHSGGPPAVGGTLSGPLLSCFGYTTPSTSALSD
jgi:light-regulated signal transduction histidine kinase (bacteriophytochrome)